jgi:hypothetical protein
MPPKRLDSLGRISEPLAEHLWEKSWQEKPAVIEEEFCIMILDYKEDKHGNGTLCGESPKIQRYHDTQATCVIL